MENKSDKAPSFVGTHQQLWRDITNTSRPQDLIEHDLAKASAELWQGILPYERKRNRTSLEKVKQLRCGDAQTNFIIEMSTLMNLDEEICHKLFTSWLLHEYCGTLASLSSILADERSRFSLLTRLCAFIHSDRSYLHMTIKHIVTMAHDTVHPLHEVFLKFIAGVKQDSSDVYKLLAEEYKALSETEPPVNDDSPLNQLWTDVQLTAWWYQTLREQVLVLETLLIYCFYSDFNPTEFAELLSMFRTKGLTGQPPVQMKQVVGDIHKPLLKRVEHLQVAIILAAMKLGTVQDGDHPFIMPSDSRKKMDALMMSRLGSVTAHGAILFGWVVLRLSSHDDPDRNVMLGLGEKAIAVGAIPYIHEMLMHLQQHEFCDQLCAVTLYALMSQVLLIFDLAAMDEMEAAVEISSSLLRYESVSESVMEAGKGDGLFLIIHQAAESFPLNFYPLMQLLSSVAESSHSGARYVVKYMLHLSTFTEYIDEYAQRNIQFVSDTQGALIDKKPLFGNVELPAGTLANLPDAGGPPTVQWLFSFNGWDLLSSELSALGAKLHLVADPRVQKRLLLTTQLLAAICRYAPCTGEAALKMNSCLYHIIHGLATMEHPPPEVLASCLNLAGAFAVFDPTSVAEQICITFLPFVADLDTCSADSEVHGSLLRHSLYQVECVQGRYTTLLATLRLMCTLLSPPSCPSVRQRLLPSVLYIIKDVFVCFCEWRFVDPSERDVLAELCLELIHRSLTVMDTDKTEDKLEGLCTSILLHSSAGQLIIQMMSIGSDILDLVLLEQSSYSISSVVGRKGPSSIIYRLRLCLSLLRRLLVLAHETNQRTLLEDAISSVLTPQRQHVTTVIASYTYHRHDTRIAILSTQLLTTIAKSQLSLMASFGDEATTIRSRFLRRLKSRSEDPAFKVVVVELLTVCVEKQPGLLELFLTRSPEEDPLLLDVLQELMSSERQFTHLCPGELLLACLNFILSLWAAGRERVTKELAVRAEFWKSVVAPLQRPLGDVSTGSQSHPHKSKIYCNVLQVLAYQLFCRDPTMKHFKTTISTLRQDIWTGISEYVRSEINSLGEIADVSDKALRQHSVLLLLDSWRMFCTTIQLADGTVLSSLTALHILNDILESLSEQALMCELSKLHCRLAAMLGAMYFHLLNKWQSFITDWMASFQKLTSVLLEMTSINTLFAAPSVLIGVIGSLHLFICKRITSPYKNADKVPENVLSLLNSLLTLLPLCCREGITESAGENSQSVRKLRLVALSTLHELVRRLPEEICVASFHERYVIPGLMSVTAYSIKSQTDIEFVSSCLAFYTMLAQQPLTAALLKGTLAEELCMVSLHLYTQNETANDHSALPSESSDEGCAILSAKRSDSTSWNKLYAVLLNLVSTCLKTMSFLYVQDAANFVAVHSDRMFQALTTIAMDVSEGFLREVKATCLLLARLSEHSQQWTSFVGCATVWQIVACVCFAYNDCIALLHRTKTIQRMLSQHVKGVARCPDEAIDIAPTRKLLIEIACDCLTIMRRFTPELRAITLETTLDLGSYELLVTMAADSSLDLQKPLSLTTLSAAANHCIGLLTKSERSPSRVHISDDEVDALKPKISYLLENSLYVLLTQVALLLRSPGLDTAAKRAIKQHTKVELTSLQSGLQRYLRKSNPQSPSPGSTAALQSRPLTSPGSRPLTSPKGRRPSSPGSRGQEVNFSTFVDDFIKHVLS